MKTNKGNIFLKRGAYGKKNLESVFFLLFPDNDFHFNSGLGESKDSISTSHER